MEDQEQPQEIICSGGIKINFGVLFGHKPQQEEEKTGSDE